LQQKASLAKLDEDNVTATKRIITVSHLSYFTQKDLNSSTGVTKDYLNNSRIIV
jgi:hypothetical protein